MNKLHPKAVYLFWIKNLILWLAILSFFLAIIVARTTQVTIKQVFNGGETEAITPVSFLGLPWIITLIIFWLLGTYIWARLTYRFWRYEFVKRRVKIERGVIFKRYVTIPYERIQNIDINRGIMDRILGLSTLAIQTAGAGRGTTEGKLPGLGIETAEEIRERLTERIENTESGL